MKYRPNNMETYEKKYYADPDKLFFPHTDKTYLESSCHEWESVPMEEKLSDLGYLVTHGFQLKNYVHQYLHNHSESELYIESAFEQYISYMRSNGDEVDESIIALKLNDAVSLDELIDLFCQEVALRYDCKVDLKQDLYGKYKKVYCQYLKPFPAWDYEAIALLHLSKEEYLRLFKCPTDIYTQIITAKQ